VRSESGFAPLSGEPIEDGLGKLGEVGRLVGVLGVRVGVDGGSVGTFFGGGTFVGVGGVGSDNSSVFLVPGATSGSLEEKLESVRVSSRGCFAHVNNSSHTFKASGFSCGVTVICQFSDEKRDANHSFNPSDAMDMLVGRLASS